MNCHLTESYGTVATNERRNGHLSRDAPRNQPAEHKKVITENPLIWIAKTGGTGNPLIWIAKTGGTGN